MAHRWAAPRRFVLHGFPTSSTSFAARFALLARGADFEELVLPIRMRSDGRPDANGCRPFLEEPGAPPLSSLSAILARVDALPGEPFVPADPEARAQALALKEFCTTEVAPYGYYRVQRYLEDELGASPAQSAGFRLHWLAEGFAGLERLLRAPAAGGAAAPGKFLVGDAVTVADLVVLPQVHWSQRDQQTRVDLAAYPLLRGVYRAALREPAFRDALPERQVNIRVLDGGEGGRAPA